MRIGHYARRLLIVRRGEGYCTLLTAVVTTVCGRAFATVQAVTIVCAAGFCYCMRGGYCARWGRWVLHAQSGQGLQYASWGRGLPVVHARPLRGVTACVVGAGAAVCVVADRDYGTWQLRGLLRGGD